MIKKRLIALVKNNKFIYKTYFYCGSLFLKFIGLFVKTDPNLVLFSSYGGRKYDDSPRVLYEYLMQSPNANKYKLVWAFTDPAEYPEIENRITIDTPTYYLTALRAGFWITNTSISRGMDFKKKSTKNILFEHGMAGIKRFAADVAQPDKVFITAFYEQYDLVFIEGKKEIPILKKAWHLDEGIFVQTGLPRNDDLVEVTTEEVISIKNRLGIPLNKKVILYAPTFRDYRKGEDGRSALPIPIDFAKWEKAIGSEYILLITAHYEVAKLLDSLPKNQFVVNAFGYPRINDLMKIADILISDYSSIIFDYSILERPILCYGYDYEEFLATRGTYMNIEEFFCDGVIRNEDDLLKKVEMLDYLEESRYTAEKIKNEYLATYGNAAKKAARIIFEEDI